MPGAVPDTLLPIFRPAYSNIAGEMDKNISTNASIKSHI
jgi:hypothetical protein